VSLQKNARSDGCAGPGQNVARSYTTFFLRASPFALLPRFRRNCRHLGALTRQKRRRYLFTA
jgi:hypothetical protein